MLQLISDGESIPQPKTTRIHEQDGINRVPELWQLVHGKDDFYVLNLTKEAHFFLTMYIAHYH